MSFEYYGFYNPFVAAYPKKYAVYVKKNTTTSTCNGNRPYLIKFGDQRYEHYYDKLLNYSHLNHLDKERRRRYRARARNIRDKHGRLTYKNKNTANYWAYNYLW